ncbi:MAG: tetratricopeptide repeat protein [Anaerolineaceae bacterium]|nr:tetratricopeptide repeat protein [Anaerolineaceae bacterium]
MTIPLLSTKFNIPSSGRSLVRRQQLIQLLDDGITQSIPIIIVSAPAGYGKTTVISDWIRHSLAVDRNSVAWLTLEKSDNYLVGFLTYFISAIQRIVPEFGVEILNAIQTHKSQSPEILATLIINQINVSPQKIYLVLDDYHLISASPIHLFMSFLIDHLPPQLCLIIISRSDPHFSLARLRTYGQLIEIRQNSLSFNIDEAKELLSRNLYPSFQQEEIAKLTQCTEGWISGLHLAAISMRDIQDRSTYFENLSGEHEFIAAFLMDEVFNKLDDPIKNFLLKTSVLDRFTLSLCEFVTQEAASKDILEGLIENNLFIVAMDNQNTWFRYHALFSELLRKQLFSQQPDLIPQLHVRASQWFEKNHLTNEAISHAISGKDYESAIQKIVDIAEERLMKGDSIVLLQWLESIPKKNLFAHPDASILLGISLFMNGRQPDSIYSLIEEIETNVDFDQVQGELSLIHGLLAILKNDALNAIQYSNEALAQIQPHHQFYRCLVADVSGMGYTLIGDMPAAIQAFEECVAISKQTENTMMTLLVLTNLAGLHYMQGELRKAIAMCYQVLAIAKGSIGINNPLLGKTFFNLGEMLREQGDLKQAIHYLEKAAELMETYSEFGLPLANLAIARVKLNLKEWDLVQHYIDHARTHAQTGPSPQITERIVDVMQARFWLERANFPQVFQWLQSRGLLEKPITERIKEIEKYGGINEFFITENQILIRYTLAQNRPENAIEMISPILEYSSKKGNRRRLIELLILKSIALNQQDKHNLALESLQAAFSLAEPEGFQRVFLDEGKRIISLLNLAINHHVCPDFAGKLLGIILIEQSSTNTLPQSTPDHVIEPLSEREIEVLGLIAQGFSNTEIAKKLFISLSTVKGHTTNIFGKLGVKKRTQAVSFGRSIGIISDQ